MVTNVNCAVTNGNFPSRTILGKTPGERSFGSRSVSELPDTVHPMTERQPAAGSNAVPAVVSGGAAVFPDLPPDVAARIEQSMASSRSTGTRRAYASAWRRFETWCIATGHPGGGGTSKS